MGKQTFAPAPPALKDDFAFLSKLAPPLVGEFCGVALGQLQEHGSASKMFARAAKQLGVATDEVESGVRALSYILVRAANIAAPADRLVEGLPMTLPEEALAVLQQAYAKALPALQQAQIARERPPLARAHRAVSPVRAVGQHRHAAARVQLARLAAAGALDARALTLALLRACARRGRCGRRGGTRRRARSRPASLCGST